MTVFLQAIYGQVFLTCYIFWHAYHALPPTKGWRTGLLLLLVAQWLLYFTGFFFRKELPDEVFIPILRICGTWYIAAIYLSLGLFVLDLVRLSNRLVPWYPPALRNHWTAVKQTLCGLYLLGIAALMGYGHYQATHPLVKHVQVRIPKQVAGRDSLKLVLMSDLHVGELIGKKQTAQFVALCNQQQPDLVVIAGDVVDYESHYAAKQRIENELQQLQAPLGVYMVLGNHDYRANREAKRRWFKQTGATLLVDSVAMPDSAFYLVGRDDAINKYRTPLRSLLQAIDTTKPVLVIDHQPRMLYEAAMNQADLCLHGHTHKGQFWPYSWLLDTFIFKHFYGLYQIGQTQFFVTSGIGYAGIPYRVGSRSELIVLHIVFNTSN